MFLSPKDELSKLSRDELIKKFYISNEENEIPLNQSKSETSKEEEQSKNLSTEEKNTEAKSQEPIVANNKEPIVAKTKKKNSGPKYTKNLALRITADDEMKISHLAMKSQQNNNDLVRKAIRAYVEIEHLLNGQNATLSFKTSDGKDIKTSWYKLKGVATPKFFKSFEEG